MKKKNQKSEVGRVTVSVQEVHVGSMKLPGAKSVSISGFPPSARTKVNWLSFGAPLWRRKKRVVIASYHGMDS